jgi:hypothetical protein
MESQGLPFLEAQAKRIPIGIPLQEIKAWRANEAAAGRPSGFDDFCRAHGIPLCAACMGEGLTLNDNGIGFKAVGLDGHERLYQRCEVCGGTGRARST